MDNKIQLTKKAQKELDERFKLQGEAEELLAISVAEFETDPPLDIS